MRPPAAFCSGKPDGHIHGIDPFTTAYQLKIMHCYHCEQQIIRVDKTENLAPSDIGYQYATRTIITEWP